MKKNSFLILALIFLLTGILPSKASFAEAPSTPQAQKILLIKSERKMYLFDDNKNVLRRYVVSLGKNPRGQKEREGDGRTPEGRYTISGRNENSQYHLSLELSYPNARQKRLARRSGTDPGGEIFIHGLPNGKEKMTHKYNKSRDWTNGCIAVNNREMRELWDMVPDGTPIIILP